MRGLQRPLVRSQGYFLIGQTLLSKNCLCSTPNCGWILKVIMGYLYVLPSPLQEYPKKVEVYSILQGKWLKSVFFRGYLGLKLSQLPTERFFFQFLSKVTSNHIFQAEEIKKSTEIVCLGAMLYFNFYLLMKKIENPHSSNTNDFGTFFISSA